MSDVITDAPATPAPAPKPRSTAGDKIRFVLRGIGQTLITLGLVVLLFVVYEVWITNIFADRNNRRNIATLRKQFESDVVDPLNLPGGKIATIPVGSGIGILYVPRLGRNYAEAIVQGDPTPNDEQLQQGVAHYGDTQLPGELGNFAVAGHRVGKGEPFLNIDQLRSGDAVIVETKSFWYVYRVFGSPTGGNPQSDTPGTDSIPGVGDVKIPGRQIIDPSDGNVLFPVPNHPEIPLDKANERIMTMTTCHPKFTASQRMIIFSYLATKVPARGDAMPAAITALYSEVNA
jgi:sortase A